MAWYNSDGLYIKFGTEEGTVGKAGEYRSPGPQRFVEYDITLTSLATTEAIIDDNTVIPAGARIEKVEVYTTTAATSGGAATLDIGFVRTDRSTTYDDDGLVAALALTAIDSVGETSALTKGSTGAGALVGTVLANNGLLTASYNTAAFTAGAVKVRVYWAK